MKKDNIIVFALIVMLSSLAAYTFALNSVSISLEYLLKLRDMAWFVGVISSAFLGFFMIIWMPGVDFWNYIKEKDTFRGSENTTALILFLIYFGIVAIVTWWVFV